MKWCWGVVAVISSVNGVVVVLVSVVNAGKRVLRGGCAIHE